MIETNWFVITGAPSSGKTTLINELAALGYKISPEVARSFIEHELAAKHPLSEINQDLLQHSIAQIMQKREQEIPVKDTYFFDRGLPDSVAYFRFNHLDTSEVELACKQRHYKKIFFCHRLPLVHDNVRIEDDLDAETIGQLIYESYQNLGYELIELPAISVAKRLDIILSHIDL